MKRWKIFQIGKLWGVDIKADLFFLLGFALGIWLLGVAFTLILWVSIVAHEYGHVLMARRLGILTHDIQLTPVGGFASITSAPKNASEEIQIAVAGPAVSLGLALLSHLLCLLLDLQILYITGNLNLGIAFLNMLPIPPMDGGRVLRAVLVKRGSSFRKATVDSLAFGKHVGIGIVVSAIFAGEFAIAAVFLFVVFSLGKPFLEEASPDKQKLLNLQAGFNSSDPLWLLKQHETNLSLCHDAVEEEGLWRSFSAALSSFDISRYGKSRICPKCYVLTDVHSRQVFCDCGHDLRCL